MRPGNKGKAISHAFVYYLLDPRAFPGGNSPDPLYSLYTVNLYERNCMVRVGKALSTLASFPGCVKEEKRPDIDCLYTCDIPRKNWESVYV